MQYKTIGEINHYASKNVNPARFPEQYFELYSVPHFSEGHPEIIKGKDVGATKQVVQEGDVLICKINPRINRVWKVTRHTDYPLIASSEWVIVRNADLNADYLTYYFSSPKFRVLINSEVTGMGGSLTRAQPKQIRRYSVPVQDKEKQHFVVRNLALLDYLISLRQRQAEKLDELVKARFVEMFGDLAAPNCKWETIKIVEACENENDIKCGPFGTQLSKNEYQETGVAVWEIPQINSGFQMVPTHFLTAEKAEALRDYSIVPGDIAMSRKGNVGKCAVFPESLEAGIIHSDVLRIRVNHETVSAIFLMYQLHFSEAVKHQIAIVSSGAIMAGINVTKLKKIRIHIPPLALQTEFAHFVHEVDREKERIQRSAALLETLKRSLMQQYFG